MQNLFSVSDSWLYRALYRNNAHTIGYPYATSRFCIFAYTKICIDFRLKGIVSSNKRVKFQSETHEKRNVFYKVTNALYICTYVASVFLSFLLFLIDSQFKFDLVY